MEKEEKSVIKYHEGHIQKMNILLDLFKRIVQFQNYSIVNEFEIDKIKKKAIVVPVIVANCEMITTQLQLRVPSRSCDIEEVRQAFEYLNLNNVKFTDINGANYTLIFRWNNDIPFNAIEKEMAVFAIPCKIKIIKEIN